MPVSYTKADRLKARESGGVLVTVAAGGLPPFAGAVSPDDAERVLALIFELREKYAAAAKASEKAPTEDAV